eukprot:COSAG01_NODE_6503_length_3629_cov_17.985269_7_plen_125_part_00
MTGAAMPRYADMVLRARGQLHLTVPVHIHSVFVAVHPPPVSVITPSSSSQTPEAITLIRGGHQPHRTLSLCHARVRVEIMGSQNCRIVEKSQSLHIMINPIIFTRTRTQMAYVCRRERLCFRRV